MKSISKSIYSFIFLIIFMSLNKVSIADEFKDCYKTLKKIESATKVGVNRFEFKKLLVDAMTEYDFIKEEEINKESIGALYRALTAYRIVDSIWSNMNDESACISPQIYKKALRDYPRLKSWKWSKKGVGVVETYMKPFDCYVILNNEFKMVWVPCLFKEASIALEIAKNAY